MLDFNAFFKKETLRKKIKEGSIFEKKNVSSEKFPKSKPRVSSLSPQPSSIRACLASPRSYTCILEVQVHPGQQSEVLSQIKAMLED